MPLQKIQLRPGVNKEGTTLANEGGWFECDKIRFRSGYPEKIGGWTALTYTTFLGTCRSLWNWITLRGFNLLGLGTNIKFYVEDGGIYNDITPLRATTTAGDVTFAADTTAPYSSTLTVTDTGHGGQTGDYVTFSDAVSLGGNITAPVLNQEYQMTVVSSSEYTIEARDPITDLPVLSNASDVGDGGTATVGYYQITTGNDIYTIGTGWGTGSWGRGSWGSSFSSGIGQQLRLWSQSNYGENLIISPRGGAFYIWGPGSGGSPDYNVRATLVSGTDCPALLNQIMVADAQRIVVAFGCNDYGAYGTTPQDPLLIRWSDVEDYTSWTPLITNQAGSYRLSHGSQIIAALQTRQEILVWTDSALYSMQYVGAPFIWTFQLLADNISIISPNAMTTSNGVTYWMGVDKFYTYAGRTETLPSSLRQYVYNDINRDQNYQAFAGTNEGFSEVWWFYCAANSNAITRYVIFNYLDRVWYYGTLGRTAWLDSALRNFPIATTENNITVYHEFGIDDGAVNPPVAIDAFIQSSDFDIGEGHNYGFVSRMVPDITFNGSTANLPAVTMTIRPRQNPGSAYGTDNNPVVVSTQNYSAQNSYEVQQFTQLIYVRARGRQMALKVASNQLGVQWQLGVPSADVRPDGRR